MQTWTCRNGREFAAAWDQAKDGDVILLMIDRKADFELDVEPTPPDTSWTGCAC